MASSSGYVTMTDNNHDFASWDERRLGKFFRDNGLGAYEAILIKHKITGHLAPLITDADLKEMGIDIIGDRLKFKLCLKELARKHRFQKRVEPLWEGQEKLFHSPCEKSCLTVGGLFPVDPGTYKLTRNHLRVKHVKPVRCFCVPLPCFGLTHTSNNIDLSKVDDVDITGMPAPCCQRTCCFARGIDAVEIESRFEKGGKITLMLDEGTGEVVSNLILNQVEESQKMERS